MNFEDMDTEPWPKKKKKNDGFWLLWGIFKEHVKQNIIMAVLRIGNADLVAICRLINKKKCKRSSKWESWFKLWFFSSCLVLMRF